MKRTHQGLSIHRLLSNPEEKKFADAWQEHNDFSSTLAYLLDPMCTARRPNDPSDRDVQVAATVIQWLGSPVGRGFLRDVGYVKDDDTKSFPKMTVTLKQFLALDYVARVQRDQEIQGAEAGVPADGKEMTQAMAARLRDAGFLKRPRAQKGSKNLYVLGKLARGVAGLTIPPSWSSL